MRARLGVQALEGRGGTHTFFEKKERETVIRLIRGWVL